jgi:uncharacterized membrane protein YgcG
MGVGSPDAPDQYRLEDAESQEGPLLRIRIGDPDQTVTGGHEYRIDYRVQGALDEFTDHDELYWKAVGSQWKVPIGEASATVTAPAAITHVACHAGPAGVGRPCGSSVVDGRSASFAVADLRPHEGLTVGVGFPTGVVPPPRPLLEERWSLARAFAATPASLGMAGAVAVLLIAGALLAAGRERRAAAASSGIGVAVEDPAGPGPSGAGLSSRVVSAPPGGLRPAQAGLLLHRRVAPVAVPATLLDLAARGYLRIEEHPVQGSRRRVWHVVRPPQPEHDLRAYERVLLVQLFGRRTLRRLPDLHRRFRDRFDRVRGALEEEAVQLGWFTAEPGQVQATWARRGAALVVIGAVLLGLAVWRARLALVPIPIIVAGLVVWWGGRWLPRRTPTGTALARRVAGFRSYLQTPWTDPRGAAAAERVFSEELPYVVVFGRTRRWVRARPQLGASAVHSSWYLSGLPLPLSWLAGQIDQTARSSARLLMARPANSGWRRPVHIATSGWTWDSHHSSSGGFSGGGGSDSGGGGGGGGDSW